MKSWYVVLTQLLYLFCLEMRNAPERQCYLVRCSSPFPNAVLNVILPVRRQSVLAPCLVSNIMLHLFLLGINNLPTTCRSPL
jgi:hypothetical protein